MRIRRLIVMSWMLMLTVGACARPARNPPLLKPTIASTATIASTTTQSPTQVATQADTIIDTSTATYSFHTITLTDGAQFEYAVALPNNFDPNQTYPILLALPPGGQDKRLVEVGLDDYWADEARKRGWIVLSPVAPDGVLFFEGAERLIPEFLDAMAKEYKPEGGKVHLAGVSNGGISAFRIAVNHPERFHSLLVLPGFPYSEDDASKLGALKNIPVTMFVGEGDTSWVGVMKQTQRKLSDLGVKVTLEIVPGEGHVIRSLTGKKLFDLLKSFRKAS